MVDISTRSVDYKKKTNICTVLDVRLDVEYDGMVLCKGIKYYCSGLPFNWEIVFAPNPPTIFSLFFIYISRLISVD